MFHDFVDDQKINNKFIDLFYPMQIYIYICL